MTGHCKDCRHWHLDSKEASHWPCFLPKQQIGLCRIASPRGGDESYGPLMAAVDIGEGIYSDLMTDERFGCVLFAEKDPDKGKAK